MSPLASHVAAACFVLLAAAHSFFGERMLIAPLADASWELPRLPRAFAAVLLRVAWHLLSLAWLAAAAILIAEAPTPGFAHGALAVLALVSALAILLPGRGSHPAWALFALAGGAALVAGHGWPSAGVAKGLGGLAATVLAGLAALHVYWAAGGRRGLAAAIPQRADGRAAFAPSAALTLLVAAALLGAAALLASTAGWLPALPLARELSLAVAAVFALRMIGDFRFCGLFRRVRRGTFARQDAALYTPLCAALATACLFAAW